MIILDGGLGRQLEAMGAPFRQPEWSAAALIEGPHFVRAAHDAFIAAEHCGELHFEHAANQIMQAFRKPCIVHRTLRG